MGNSEVGHLTIGAGRAQFQDLVKINLAIEENRFERWEHMRVQGKAWTCMPATESENSSISRLLT